MEETLKNILENLKSCANYRTIQPMQHNGLYVNIEGKTYLNLASNDYLGIARNAIFLQEFLQHCAILPNLFSSSSSRILSGNFEIFEIFEQYLKTHYGFESALLFNSGYHANLSIIDCLNAIPNILFLADSFVHASIFDGLRIAKAKFLRFAHNNMQELEILLQRYHHKYKHIIILSEGLFSMDGDFCKLDTIVTLKKSYANVLLYLDEAHSLGVCGENLLGLAQELNLLESIDFLILAFGKAIGSVGGCVLCKDIFRQYFINKARGLIYSTALPPINIAFCLFVFERLQNFKPQQEKLASLSHFIRHTLRTYKQDFLGQAHIISLMTYENEKALLLSQKLLKAGYFAPAIKYPSVPNHQARIRLSLCADFTQSHFDNLLEILCK